MSIHSASSCSRTIGWANSDGACAGNSGHRDQSHSVRRASNRLSSDGKAPTCGCLRSRRTAAATSKRCRRAVTFHGIPQTMPYGTGVLLKELYEPTPRSEAGRGQDNDGARTFQRPTIVRMYTGRMRDDLFDRRSRHELRASVHEVRDATDERLKRNERGGHRIGLQPALPAGSKERALSGGMDAHETNASSALRTSCGNVRDRKRQHRSVAWNIFRANLAAMSMDEVARDRQPES